MTGSIALAADGIVRFCRRWSIFNRRRRGFPAAHPREWGGTRVAKEPLGLPPASRRATCNLVEADAAAVLLERNWRKISRGAWKNAFGVIWYGGCFEPHHPSNRHVASISPTRHLAFSHSSYCFPSKNLQSFQEEAAPRTLCAQRTWARRVAGPLPGLQVPSTEPAMVACPFFVV